MIDNGEIEVVSSRSSHHSAGYTQHITVIINDFSEINIDDLADEISQKYIDNNLDGIRFSFDTNGYPEELNVLIYKSKTDYEKQKIYSEFTFKKTTDNPIIYEY